MRRKKVTGVFSEAYKKVNKLKGEEKEKAYTELYDRIEMYNVARDFSRYYPKLYTDEVFDAIVKAKNNVEAANILASLRKRQGDCGIW